ncbi:DMT family transporter [Streptomyces sp. G45]|uniref:DMT family transporter n=1 Tax=Streptomyces sp. G45 TaxID=3406627 RepID=UPI003C1DEDBE
MPAQGYGFALLTAAFFGAGAVLANRVTADIHPLLTTELNLAIGAALLGTYLAVRRRPLLPRGLGRGDWVRLAFVSVVGTGLSLALVITGLSMTSPVNGGFLIQLQGPAAVLASVAVLGDRLRWWQTLGIAVTLFGGLLIVMRSPSAGLTSIHGGDVLVLLGALLAGIAYLPAKSLMDRVPALQLSLWRLLPAAVVLLPVLPLVPGRLRWHPTTTTLTLQLVLAVTNFCLAYVTLHLALARLRPWQTASVLQLEPAFTVVISLAALALVPTPLQFAGGALMIAGGLVAQRPDRTATEPAPAPPPTSTEPLTNSQGSTR